MFNKHIYKHKGVNKSCKIISEPILYFLYVAYITSLSSFISSERFWHACDAYHDNIGNILCIYYCLHCVLLLLLLFYRQMYLDNNISTMLNLKLDNTFHLLRCTLFSYKEKFESVV